MNSTSLEEHPASSDLVDPLTLLLSVARDYALFSLNDSGLIQSWSASAERIYGYAASAIVGRSVEPLYPADQWSSESPHALQSLDALPLETEEWHQRADQSRFPAHVIISKTSNAEGMTVVVRDLSRARNEESRFYRIIDSAPNAMVVINQEGRIEMVNVQTERLFGYTRSELEGSAIEMLLPEQFRAHHPALRQGFFHAPQSRPMGKGRDLYARRKDGSEFPVEIGLNPIETGGETLILSAIVDISERKQKEQRIQAALEEKNVLLGEIHHRVKNNLQVVHSLLDLQSSMISDPQVQEMLLDSQNRIRSMALIHQSLYQSKNFSAVSLGSVLETLIPILMQSYRSTNQLLDYTIDSEDVDIPLNQAIPCGLIVNELITNVIKHAFPGDLEGAVQVQLRRHQNQVSLSVTDNGVGIPESLNIEKSDTLGMQLVALLSDQLGASLDIHHRNPTRFTLTFEIEASNQGAHDENGTYHHR